MEEVVPETAAHMNEAAAEDQPPRPPQLPSAPPPPQDAPDDAARLRQAATANVPTREAARAKATVYGAPHDRPAVPVAALDAMVNVRVQQAAAASKKRPKAKAKSARVKPTALSDELSVLAADVELASPTGKIIRTIEDLPPLPTPLRCKMCKESIWGFVIIPGLFSLFVVVVHSISEEIPDSYAKVMQGTVHAATFVAALCWAAVVFSDPGVVKRTAQNCFPVPPDVEDRLRRGLPLPDNRPSKLEDRSRWRLESEHLTKREKEGGNNLSYCVRCMVWRPNHAYHCTCCQRCVLHFDHHCGMFGVCIAGKGWAVGNWRYFKTLLYMAGACSMTFLLSLVLSIVFSDPDDYGPQKNRK